MRRVGEKGEKRERKDWNIQPKIKKEKPGIFNQKKEKSAIFSQKLKIKYGIFSLKLKRKSLEYSAKNEKEKLGICNIQPKMKKENPGIFIQNKNKKERN